MVHFKVSVLLKLIFSVLYKVRLLIGTTVFVANFLIFTIFATKKRKLPSDLLVMPNLTIDSFYGLCMCFQFYFTDPGIKVNLEFCLQIFILFSLIMLILMTANRFVAAVRPIKYKLGLESVSYFSLISESFTVAVFSAGSYVLFLVKVLDQSFIIANPESLL